MFGNGKVWLCVHKRAVIVESHFKRRITLYNIFFGADATSLQVGNVWGVAIKVAMYDVCKTIMRSFSYRGCLCMLAHLTYIFPAKKTTDSSYYVCFRVYNAVLNIFRASAYQPRRNSAVVFCLLGGHFVWWYWSVIFDFLLKFGALMGNMWIGLLRFSLLSLLRLCRIWWRFRFLLFVSRRRW